MLIPDVLRPVGTSELLVIWNNGERRLYSYPSLRFYCPCAGCVDEMTGERRIRLADVQDGIQALDWKPVGNYAIQFRWSDGHQTGIYAFDYLRQMPLQ